MIEEYENWEDSIRRTFIELADYMEKNSDPIEFVIEFAWANGCDLSTINQAKDLIAKLKREDVALHESVSNNYTPIDILIDLCEKATNTGQWKVSSKNIEDARNSLSKLKSMKRELAKEAYNANQFATEELNLYLETSQELGNLQKNLANPVAWARINERGDLYDLRLQNNPYDDQEKIVPLYRAKK